MIVLLLFSLNLTLEEAIEIGLKESPAYLKAKKTFTIQQKTNSLFYSTLLPEVSGEYSYYRTHSESGGVTFVDTSSDFGFFAAWELGPGDIFNSLGTHYKNASAYYSFIDMRNGIVYDIAFQYLKTLMMKKLLESRIAGVNRSEKNLKLVEEKKTLGLASNAEVLKAKVDHFQSKTNLLDTKKQARVSALILNNLIGLSVKDSLNLTEPDIEFNIPSKDSVLHLAIEKDPLYNQYKSDVKVAQYDLIGNTTENLFSISFSGGLQYQGADFPSVSVLQDNYDYSIGFSVRVPIFTGFSRYNELMINKLKKDLADINLKDRGRELKVVVEDEYLSYNETKEKRELASMTLDFATESHQATSERYNLGEASIIEFLEAEEDLLEAQYSMTQARFDWYLSVYKLKRLMGILI